MNISEQEIEDIVCGAIEKGNFAALQERGLPFSNEYSYFRQMNLGSYGRADIIGINARPSFVYNGEKRRSVYVQIIELKKDEINLNTLHQAIRYAKGLEHKFAHERVTDYYLHFFIHLIGRTIDSKSTFPYLPDIFPNVHMYTYSISLEKGVVFNPVTNWRLTNPSFRAESDDLKIILRNNVRRKAGRMQVKVVSNWGSFEDDGDLPF